MRLYTIHVFFLVILCAPTAVFSQEGISKKKAISEENFLKFQESFFKALAQKSIYNYRAAIQNLEKCNEIKPNDVSVLFELSKNYVLLNTFFEAEYYAKQALSLEPNNYWILMHLSQLYVASNNRSKAIKIHEQIATINPKEQEKLVYLYYQNKQREKSKQLLLELENKQLLTPGLTNFKKRFVKKTRVKKETKTQGIQELLKEFEQTKRFETLREILTRSVDSDPTMLLTYSKIGLELYPAQAFVYLMNGKALNQKQDCKKALEQLNNGIDFVIDDVLLEAAFYEERARSYDCLGNAKEALENKNKAVSLRKKRKE